MLGEHRPTLADLLWERAQMIIKSIDMADLSAIDAEEGGQAINDMAIETIINTYT
jgi:hypothetical protein